MLNAVRTQIGEELYRDLVGLGEPRSIENKLTFTVSEHNSVLCRVDVEIAIESLEGVTFLAQGKPSFG